ncbi:MAG: sulfotransferase [Candidatus Binatia bacterium]|nr:sulfotransferase [Candidatus Binatia bacterium]
MERPADLHIDDLAHPRFDPAIREMMDQVAEASAPVQFTTDAVLRAASEQTGLEDFGDDQFRGPLDALLSSIEHEGNLTPFGRISYFTLLLTLAKNRLQIQDLLMRHPEIHDIEIQAPIVIAGLQRTGTTNLHSMLSADPNLRSLPYWESLEPVLGPGAMAEEGQPDPRIALTEVALSFQEQVIPHFNRMHEMTVDHAHEEIQILAIDFSTMLFESMATLPGFRDYYLSHDQQPHYEYMKTCLKALTWLRGGKRWVLKSPQHIEQIPAVLATFPDATVVFTHRDPVSVIASTATMLAYAARMHQSPVDTEALGAYWVDRTERMLRSCMRDRDLVAPERSMDVLFHEYMKDDMAIVHQIYDLAGQPLPASSRAAMAAYTEAHPRGRFGRISYKLADFGLTADEVRERTRFYVDHFGLEMESTAL